MIFRNLRHSEMFSAPARAGRGGCILSANRNFPAASQMLAIARGVIEKKGL